MKVSDIKKGQLVSVNFPYGANPDERFEFRVVKDPYKAGAPVRFSHSHGKPVFEDPYFVVVRDLKTLVAKKFAFETLEEEVANWRVVEEPQPFTQPPAQA